MPDDLKPCPQCQSPYGYPTDGTLFMCPECGHEWNPAELVVEETGLVVKDANSNVLAEGDTVVIIKNLPVKGSSGGLKAGTKVKNIRLKEGDHNID